MNYADSLDRILHTVQIEEFLAVEFLQLDLNEAIAGSRTGRSRFLRAPTVNGL